METIRGKSDAEGQTDKCMKTERETGKETVRDSSTDTHTNLHIQTGRETEETEIQNDRNYTYGDRETEIE